MQSHLVYQRKPARIGNALVAIVFGAGSLAVALGLFGASTPRRALPAIGGLGVVAWLRIGAVKKRSIVAVLALLACAACGSSSHSLAPKSLPQLVLQPADLPGWTRFENDAGTVGDAGVLGSRDRTGAWIARYRSPRGVVVSRIDLYRSSSDASHAFSQLRTQASLGPGVRSTPTPALGDERVGYLTGTLQMLKSIFWRRANAIGSIVVQGSDVAKPDAGGLSEKVDARMKAAG